MLVMFDSSCPRLSRASTSRNASQIKDVDGRDKRGHDMDRAAIVTKIGIIIWETGCRNISGARLIRENARKRLALVPHDFPFSNAGESDPSAQTDSLRV